MEVFAPSSRKKRVLGQFFRKTTLKFDLHYQVLTSDNSLKMIIFRSELSKLGKKPSSLLLLSYEGFYPTLFFQNAIQKSLYQRNIGLEGDINIGMERWV